MAYMTGLKRVENNLNEAISDIKGDVTEGVQDVGLDLLRRSVRKAPVETGTLRGSGYVEFNNRKIAEGNAGGGIAPYGKVRRTIDNPVATVGFGEVYAAAQHEHVEYRHPKGGQAKYLEQPMKANTAKYVALIRKKAKVD